MPEVNLSLQTDSFVAEEMAKVRECFEEQLHSNLLVDGISLHIEAQLHALINEMIGQLGIFRVQFRQ